MRRGDGDDFHSGGVCRLNSDVRVFEEFEQFVIALPDRAKRLPVDARVREMPVQSLPLPAGWPPWAFAWWAR